jgi:hypothetical protein
MKAGQSRQQRIGLPQQRHLILADRPRSEPAFRSRDHALSDQEVLQHLDPGMPELPIAFSLAGPKAVLEGVPVARLTTALTRFVRYGAARRAVASGEMRCRAGFKPC